MAQPVLIKGVEGSWREPAVTSYVNERELQDLVVQSPELLTGQALATVDEFWIPEVGSVDIVGVAADGAINIVECKLRANPEIRREVIGQLLAYSGGLWQMPYEQFAATWSARAGKSVTDQVRQTTGSEDDDETIRRRISASLDSGSFTLVIAVDDITPELKRIIEYLNAATKDDVKVLGLELQYVKDRETEILIPRSYGEGLKKASGTSSTDKWTKDRFAEAVAALDQDQRDVVERLMTHGAEFGSHPWWGVGQVPGMSWYYTVGAVKLSLFQIYLRPSGVVVAPSLGGLASAGGVQGRELALLMLSKLCEFTPFVAHLAHVNSVDLNRFPSIPVQGAVGAPGGVEAFLAAVDAVRTAPSS